MTLKGLLMAMKTELPGRLMLRAEGEWWNAYFGSRLEDAFFLGQIRMSIVVKSEKAKTLFMSAMSEAVADAVEAILGQRPDMTVTAAPENERSGNA